MSSLASLGTGQIVGFVLVLARLSPLFLLAPLFSSKLVPGRVRAIVAVALAVGLTPLAVGGRRVPVEVVGVAELVVKEILVGLAFAFAVGALFAALTVAGSLLDTLVGFSFGALVDPLTGNQGTVLSQLYGLTGTLVFVAIGGDGMLIRGLAETYELVPLLEAPALGSLVEGVQTAFVGVLASAVQVAAPVLLALVLTDVAFGLVSKVVPQLNVFAVGFPAKLLVGLLLIGASLPFAASWVGDELETSVETALRSLRVA